CVFAGLALDYRRWKTFSIGAEACYHFLFQDQSDYSYPRILSAALRFGFYW
ncbi:MAG: hypothetical protein FJ088_14600, partial [Deltaproteobacteria bacterium]|nr:hypothetical protein [Deltaproteobacteria bacterium]